MIRQRKAGGVQGKYDFVFMLQQMCSGRTREEEEGEADEEKELKEER